MIHLLDFIGWTSTNKMYNFWSGFGSDVTELGIIFALVRHLNCHEKGCWRIGHHVNGTMVCHLHRKDTTNAV